MSAEPEVRPSGVIDEGAWRKICARYGPHFDETLHVEGLLTATAEMSAGIVRGLGAATRQHGGTRARLRIYRDSMMDYRSIERALHTSWNGTDLESWFDGVAQGGSVCMAFNEVDRWDVGLAALLGPEVIGPLVDELGSLGTAVEWYSFIGRDGWTPFGLHRDPEVSMIFHLGPAPKEVWVWDPETLPDLPGDRQLTYDFADLLPQAQHIVMRPGDFVSIPAGHFHIFRNVGFAAFLGLMIYPQDRTRLLGQVVADLAALDGVDPTSWRSAEAGRDEVVDRLTALVSTDVLERARRSLVARDLLQRSSGYSGKPFELVPVSADTITGTSVVRPYPDAVLARPADLGDPALYVRGRTVRLPTGLSAATVEALLRSRPSFTIEEFIGSPMTGGMDRAVLTDLLVALVACGGAHLEPGPGPDQVGGA